MFAAQSRSGWSGRSRRSGGFGGRGRRKTGPEPSDPDLLDSEREPGPDADPVEVARGIALRLLDSKDRTRAELLEALGRRGVEEEVATQVVARFEEVGLVDDQRYAEAYSRSRQQSRKLSASALRRELRQRGVDDETIAVAAEGIDDDLDVALEYARQRTAKLSGLARDVRYRRLAGALGRRGFPSHVIHEVLGQVLDEDPEDFD